MEWNIWIAILSLLICKLYFLVLLCKMISYGKVKDFAKFSGNVSKGILYSNTKAMMPQNKESAYLHLPTYISGMIYHIGTFASFLFFVFILIFEIFGFNLLQIFPPQTIPTLGCILGIGICISSLCGFGLLIKRAFSSKLKKISNLDDYISNFLTSLFQLFTALFILTIADSLYFTIAASVLLLYMPIGKLKHVLYYFFARFHLGYFYGSRNVWPQ